jgi:hypothetical protein
LAGSTSDEYFTNLAKQIAEQSKVRAQVQHIFLRMVAFYDSLSIEKRAKYTGIYASLDIKASAELMSRIPAFADLYTAEKWKSFTILNVADGKEGGCCQELQMRLDRMEVVKTTSGPGRDNVAITGVSDGAVMSPNPTPFKWPVDTSGKSEPAKMGDSDNRNPNELIAKVTHGQGCHIVMSTKLTFFEVDFNKIDEFLRQAIEETINSLQKAASGVGAPPSAAGLINSIISAILDALGLSDDVMDTFTITVSGSITSKIDIVKDLTWTKPGDMTLEGGGRVATLTKR